MRDLKFPEDCKLDDCTTIKQEIQFLNRDINQLEKKMDELLETKKRILSLIKSWDKKIEFFQRLTEMQKSEGLRLTDREVIVQFCTEKLEMGSRKIGDLLGISYTTVCEIRKKIEKKKKRKLELTQEKPKQYAQLFEICRPKQYRKSVYNSIKNV